ncbi:hypothetical protein D3C85_1372830 [compost metagenome]
MGDIVLIAFYILMIVTYIVIKKHMHLFDMIFCWLMALFLDDVYFMVVTLNYELILPSPQMWDMILRLVYQHVITPMIVVWAMLIWVTKHGWIVRLGSMIFYSLMLMSIKIFLHYLGVVQYASMWKLGWSYLESLLLIICTGITLLIFRAIMRKDGISYEPS